MCYTCVNPDYFVICVNDEIICVNAALTLVNAGIPPADVPITVVVRYSWSTERVVVRISAPSISFAELPQTAQALILQMGLDAITPLGERKASNV